jgi:eukaryotic-like serine/threonine-protein kinase
LCLLHHDFMEMAVRIQKKMMSEIDSVHPDSGYFLLSLLAEGSRGRVYLGQDSNRGKHVAVKFMREDAFENAKVAESNLNHEAQCLSLAAHGNVLVKLDTGVNAGGKSYLVTEYLAGQSLKQIMGGTAMDAVTVFNLILPLTAALENMHKIGVLHLDLRPDKIIVERAGKNTIPRIIGFGRAGFLPWAGREVTVETPSKCGLYSLQYASPEQAMDKRCLPSSDVYSLGCIMYEAITGSPPIQGENELHIMASHLSGKIKPPSQLTGNNKLARYDEVIMQALAAETHKRFVDAAELREAITRLIPTGWMARLFNK